MKNTVCPKCYHNRRVHLKGRPELVTCKKCGETRHWTHWKPKEVLKAAERRVSSIIRRIDSANSPQEVQRLLDAYYGSTVAKS